MSHFISSTKERKSLITIGRHGFINRFVMSETSCWLGSVSWHPDRRAKSSQILAFVSQKKPRWPVVKDREHMRP